MVLHFYGQLKSSDLYMQSNKVPIDIGHLLPIFQTHFWFDHHWIFGAHGTYLYTLTFHFDKLKDFTNFDQIQSSNSKIFSSLQTWSHVKSIDFSESFQINSNLIKNGKFNINHL
jgi:hypothetical protein